MLPTSPTTPTSTAFYDEVWRLCARRRAIACPTLGEHRWVERDTPEKFEKLAVGFFHGFYGATDDPSTGINISMRLLPSALA